MCFIFFIFIFLSGCIKNDNNEGSNSDNPADKDVVTEPVELDIDNIITIFTKTSDTTELTLTDYPVYVELI